jgi:hypothetical protein
MEQSQIEIIDTVCHNLQLIASLIQNYVRYSRGKKRKLMCKIIEEEIKKHYSIT